MSQAPRQPAEAGVGRPAVGSPPRRRWQLGLRTLVLLLAAIAVWMTYFINRRQIESLAARIATMRPLARELVIDDPRKIAVVKLQELWMDDHRWEVYLPAGQYRLCLATRGVDQTGLAPIVRSGRIGPGRHLLGLEQRREQDGWRVTATWDGTGRLTAEEPREWDSGRGSMGGGEFSLSTQLAADQPAVLFRRIFTRQDARGQWSIPSGPAEGVLLWIERVAGPETGP